jgi:8-oxo-dGTP pyrophosphatase MutT (NUDIX family)
MTKKLRHTIIPASYLVLMKDSTVLLARRHNTGYKDGLYSLAAGHVEAGESFTQAIVREAKEEIGIILHPDDVRVAHVMHRKSGADGGYEERIDIFLCANRWTGEIVNKEPHKCSELTWASINSLPADVVDFVRDALQKIDQGIGYSEWGW